MKKILFLIAGLLAIVTVSFAQEIPERPNPQKLVNDLANVLTLEQVKQFEYELEEFARQTSTQIAVVTVSDLGGTEISDFSFQLGEKWGIGQKGKNNGIVVVFKPKTSREKGQVFVAVGYGLEGVIPDAIANRDVVDYAMIPRFKQGDIYGGLYAGTSVLMKLAAGEFTAEQFHQKVSDKQSGGGIIFFIILFVFILFSLFRGRKQRYYSGGSGLPFWIAMSMLNSGRDSHRGSWDSFNQGSGGFGGGGGFGGFGGGSFGGGGAGGSW